VRLPLLPGLLKLSDRVLLADVEGEESGVRTKQNAVAATEFESAAAIGCASVERVAAGCTSDITIHGHGFVVVAVVIVVVDWVGIVIVNRAAYKVSYTLINEVLSLNNQNVILRVFNFSTTFICCEAYKHFKSWEQVAAKEVIQ